MIRRAPPPLSELYLSDETAWLDEMAELIQQCRLDELDYAHLEEYLNDMARRERREVASRLATLLMHLLKWMQQPELRGNSWRGTIIEQRHELAELADSGVLRNHAETALADAYSKAVERAAAETGLRAASFPVDCPYTLDQLLSVDFTAK